jgi:2-polyprenyl-6-methoxyphenol hydroxylase-like FAD-dependent oxidoreductase
MGSVLDIAICGAGIGGLALATLLARAGHKVRVFDQFETPQPIGSGLMLQQTGLAVLAKLGLRDEIEKLGSKIDRLWGLTTPSERPVLDVRYTKWKPDLYGIGVQRGMVFEQLLAAALASGAQLIGSTQVRSVDAQTGTFETPNGATQGKFDLVVDALGVRSPLTRRPKRDLPYGALWATLPWPKDSGFDATALEQRYHKASKMTGVMASGRANADAPESLTYFWSIRADQYQNWRSGSLDAWKTEAAALWPETRVLLDQFEHHDDLTFARYRHRTHPNPVSGPRLVHIGDAWHAASPQLGQGANMALLDAWALSKALQDSADVPGALKQFKRLRNGHVQIYQWMTWAFTPVYQGDSTVLPWLRDWLAAPLSKLWPAPPLLAAMVSGMIGAPLGRLNLRD